MAHRFSNTSRTREWVKAYSPSSVALQGLRLTRHGLRIMEANTLLRLVRPVVQEVLNERK